MTPPQPDRPPASESATWGRHLTRGCLAIATLIASALVVVGVPPVAGADPGRAVAVSAGNGHTCAVLDDASVRCWGSGADGRLGYGNTFDVGDDETPGSVAPVDLGGHGAMAIAAGGQHTCAILDDASVSCWGRGAEGQLGYGNEVSVGDDEAPTVAGPVNLGSGRTAMAIAAGLLHTCAILDDASVRCWGGGADGRLGYGNTFDVGDDETPGSVAPVDLGGHGAMAISAGASHTCAILDDASVRCWGSGEDGRLGYGNTLSVGDDETPDAAGPVDLGGHGATAIAAGGYHTCAILDDASVRCWGRGEEGQLGYGNILSIGDNETPAAVGSVNLGAGRTAVAISTGVYHSCALLDDETLRCWGFNDAGELGYGIHETIGDTETPDVVGPVDLGGGHVAAQVAADGQHTCAVRDDAAVLCWGWGIGGQLGYGNTETIGDDETPGSVGSVQLLPAPLAAPLPDPPVPPPGFDDFPPPPPPVAGKSVNVLPVAGRVGVRCPGAHRSSILDRARQISLRCLIDTRRGTVLLIASKGGRETQFAYFWGGVFSVDQRPGRNQEAVVTLVGSLGCRATSRRERGAVAAWWGPGRSGGRKLWGKGEGNFKTVGHYGSATVRGTIWLVADRCDDSTLFRVKRGVVLVRDFAKQASLMLRAGGRYVARADPRGGGR